MSSENEQTDAEADAPRQRVVRVRGSRRAKLTPAPGSDPAPEAPTARDDAPAPSGEGTGASGSRGPNDDRLRRDVPPHY